MLRTTEYTIGYTTSTPSSSSAGSRNSSARSMLPRRCGLGGRTSPAPGAPSGGGGPAARPPPGRPRSPVPAGAVGLMSTSVSVTAPDRSLAVQRLGRGGLELLRDPVDVTRVRQEVLEQLPLALTVGRAECRGVLVGHVEAHVVGADERVGDLARRLVGVRGLGDVLVRRDVATGLRPDLARLG